MRIVDKNLIGKKVEQVIDEKRLIEDLKSKIYPEKFGERCNAIDVISGVLQVIDEQPQADKWIPYTTNCELPYNGQKVWISFANEICSYVKQAWWIYDHFEWNNGKTVKDFPIAWQPYISPQPYKKEGAE